MRYDLNTAAVGTPVFLPLQSLFGIPPLRNCNFSGNFRNYVSQLAVEAEAHFAIWQIAAKVGSAIRVLGSHTDCARVEQAKVRCAKACAAMQKGDNCQRARERSWHSMGMRHVCDMWHVMSFQGMSGTFHDISGTYEVQNLTITLIMFSVHPIARVVDKSITTNCLLIT